MSALGVKRLLEELIDYVNEKYLESNKDIAIHIEMDEMRSFCHDKSIKSGLDGLLVMGVAKPLLFGLGRGTQES
jgi:hypothetical protein